MVSSAIWKKHARVSFLKTIKIARVRRTSAIIGSPTAMLVYKIMDQNTQILNKTVVIAITLHVLVTAY